MFYYMEEFLTPGKFVYMIKKKSYFLSNVHNFQLVKDLFL